MEHNHNEHHHTHPSAVSKLQNKARVFEVWLAPFFASLPHLPLGVRKFVTDIAPWLSLIIGVLGIIGLLGSRMLSVILSPLVALNNGLLGTVLFITVLLALMSSVLSILAFKPLQEMKKLGWNYVFYGFILALISTLISMLSKFGGLGDLIGIVLVAYIIFEVRERYN